VTSGQSDPVRTSLLTHIRTMPRLNACRDYQPEPDARVPAKAMPALTELAAATRAKNLGVEGDVLWRDHQVAVLVRRE
jgi:hypothetical protein